MPLTAKGQKIMSAMADHYGSPEQAKRVFYASRNKGTISGVDRARAMGGVVPGYDMGGMVDPQQQMDMASPGVMPQMPPGAPAGVAAPQMGPPPTPGMSSAPAALSAPGQWASGVAQNSAPPAIPQNAPAMPPNAAPAQQPMGKQLMANGGALQRAGGGFSMGTSPHMDAGWQTRAEARQMHTGPVLSAVPGRTDNHQVKIPSGGYVFPASHVSSLGQGNTLAGMSLLHNMFGNPNHIAHGAGAPKPPRMMKGLADGGSPGQDYGQPVPVDISGGEYVASPEAIIRRFGDLDTGHKILDRWILDTRKREIALQKKLPPPAKS